jgi:hypothetical protein
MSIFHGLSQGGLMKIRYADFLLPIGLSRSENARGLERLFSAYEYRHPRPFAGVRVAAGVWLLILTAILYGYDRAGWWTPLLLLAAAAHFYFAHRLRAIGARTNSRDAK